MHRAGVPLKNMRVCEPFGPEQRRGLWLYHILEPETWERMCRRVCGAHSGAIYANASGDYFALKTKIRKPAHFSWREYALFLLDSMPEKPPSITVIKSLFICTGTRPAVSLSIFPTSRKKISAIAMFPHGAASARRC
jgi:predicted phosphoadenosine phosphosulfate sulfurtransferase